MIPSVLMGFVQAIYQYIWFVFKIQFNPGFNGLFIWTAGM